MDITKRKEDHLKICLEENVSRGNSGFDDFILPYLALPEINFEKISTETEFLGFKVALPVFISSMTGGLTEGKAINQKLAQAAQTGKIPLALGSCRIILEKPETLESFNVKSLMPDVPLLANIGAVQLNYGWTYEECSRIVDTLKADALILHLNPLQEVLQDGGNTNFEGLMDKIAKVVKKVDFPIIVKEVGTGISAKTASILQSAGVKYIDVAGHGGTNWALVEALRYKNETQGELFATLGISTVKSLQECSAIKGINLLASGGIKNGLDVAKALYLGAKMGGLAKPFLMAENPQQLIEQLKFELKVTMFSMGISSVHQLSYQVYREGI